jgi:hypothetical protein
MRKSLLVRYLVAVPTLSLALGCAPPPAEDGHTPQLGGNVTDLASITRALERGNVGQDVKVLNEFLTEVGYFENPRLRREHTGWVPIVKTAPKDPTRFDENTEAGVRAYQRLNGLAQTGVLDPAMRATLATRFCREPDFDLASAEPRQKWHSVSNFEYQFQRLSYSWRLRGTAPSGLHTGDAIAAIQRAIATWVAQIPQSLTMLGTGGTDLTVSFGTLTGTCATGIACHTAGELPSGVSTPVGSTIVFSTNLPAGAAWSIGGAQYDVESVALHEFGHFLGLNHSSATGAVMRPNSEGVRRALTNDDIVAVTHRLNYWEQLPDKGIDIAVGANGSAWKIGDDKSNSFWNGTTWTKFGGSATRIAVDHVGTPWVVHDLHGIFRARTNGTWEQMPDAANDIGIGANGSVFIVSNEGEDVGGWVIKRWNGSSFVAFGGTASRITVGADGFPWIVQKNGHVYRRTPANTWQLLATNGRDIGAGPEGTVWMVDDQDVVSVWSEQPGLNQSGGTAQEVLGNWRVQWNGGAVTADTARLTSIAVGPGGLPWGTTRLNGIFRLDRR